MTEKATTKKGGWFSPLRAREEAIKATQDASTAFYLIAALTAVVAWVVSPSMYVDAAIYAICGYFIRTKFSRTAAVIVAILGPSHWLLR